jgi:hypothetical protein
VVGDHAVDEAVVLHVGQKRCLQVLGQVLLNERFCERHETNT